MRAYMWRMFELRREAGTKLNSARTRERIMELGELRWDWAYEAVVV